MEKDNDQLSLSDLGVEQEQTPAEQAKASAILRPGEAGGTTNASSNIVTNINDIAKNPVTDKDDFAKKALERGKGNLYELTDKNIERTKVEIMPRVEEGKRAYIDQKWKQLEIKAKKNPKIAKKIDELNNIMDTDVRFDDADDYLRHGYILAVVAHDTGTGLDPNFFGHKNDKKKFRNSQEAAEEIDKIKEEPKQNIDIYDDSVTTSLNKPNDNLPFKDIDKPEEDNEDKEVSEAPKIELSDNSDIHEDDVETGEVMTTTEDIPDEYDDDDDGLSSEDQQKIMYQYRDNIYDELNLARQTDISSFSISNRAIKISSAISNTPIRKTVTWGLQHSGQAIEMTPMSGEDLMILNPKQTDYGTIAGLRSVFSVLYRHLANPNKPDFDTWLKQLSDADTDCLLFAVYVANFKDTNIITHSCPNKKCQNVFIKKYPVEDLMIYPDEETKTRFRRILKKDTVMTNLYRSKPIAITHDYAFGFVTQSVYSSLFEPMALKEEDRKKYAPILMITPVLDTIYKIDSANAQLIPIAYGNADTTEKTVLRKIKGITQILKKFSPDERALVITEAAKVMQTHNNKSIKYRLPEAVCPLCGEKIKEQSVTPLDLLFMRAQLPILAVSMQE